MSIQFQQWLKTIGLVQYADLFAVNDIDFRSVALLSDADLKELGLTLGHRRILFDATPGLNLAGENRSPSIISATPAAGVEAERRQLTVVFCDLVGSTELSGKIDPEELRELLGHYQNVVTASIINHGGYVGKFLGDGVLAYFGWPQANEEQVDMAIRASLNVIECVSQKNCEIQHQLQVRIGIDTGQVIVGDLVGDLLSDAETVIGQTPNMAARLQGIAEPGQLLIGAGTHALLGSCFELEPLGPHNLKGFADSVPIWKVVRERDVESRFEACHSGLLTALVGRESELALLRGHWERAKSGQAQVVVLTGEAGIGKSRIIQDLADETGGKYCHRLAYQCSSHHANNAFYPVVQHLRLAAGFASGDSSDVQFEKLEAFLRDSRSSIAGAVPLLANLLSLPLAGHYATPDGSALQIRNNIIELLIQQIVSQSASTTVLCIIEDVHWCDPSMSEFIGELIQRVADRPVFLLLTRRPEYSPPWINIPQVTEITFKRLDKRQAVKIIESVAGANLPDSVTEQIVARSDGVPLFIEELTKSVLETITSDGLSTHNVVPDTLQSSLIARLDRLEGAKETAQVAAVVGREFTYRVLYSIMRKTEAELLSDLDRLVNSGLVIQHGIPPNASYTFKHALVQDVAYATILKRKRRTIHSRILEALEELASVKGVERINLLAHHACNAGEWEKAFDYRYRTGKKAMERSALHEAAAQFELSLEISTDHPEANDTLEQVIDLRLELRNALWALGRFEHILLHLEEAERMAKQIVDPVRIGWISVFRSASLWQLGRSEEALLAAEHSLAVSNTAGDQSLEISARFYLACVRVTSGKLDRAENMFESVVSGLPGKLQREQCGLPFAPAVIARSWLVWSYAERGEFDRGLSHGSAALQLAIKLENPFNLAHIYYDLGYLHIVKGDIEQGVEALQNAYDLVNEWNLRYLSPLITGFLGHAYALSGQVEEGILMLRKAQSNYDATGLGLFRSLVGIKLGEALLLNGELAEAKAMTHKSVALAESRGEQGHKAIGLCVLGDIASHFDQIDTTSALDYYTQSLESADMLGMRPLSAHCHVRIGTHHCGTNKVDRTTKHASVEAKPLSGRKKIRVKSYHSYE